MSTSWSPRFCIWDGQPTGESARLRGPFLQVRQTPDGGFPCAETARSEPSTFCRLKSSLEAADRAEMIHQAPDPPPDGADADP